MARFAKPLNNKAVDNAKPQDKPYTLTDGNGLFLLITPSGSKTWQFNYYHPTTKKRTKFSLGSYPIVTIAEARSYHDEYRTLLAKGIDPQEYLKEQEQAKSKQNENSFLNVALLWKEKRSKEIEPLTMAKNWARLEKYIFPEIGHYPINEITSPRLIKAVKPLNEKGFNDTLHRLLNLANQILNYAVTLGLIPFNSCIKASDAYHKEPQKNHPAIKPEQLPKLLKDFRDSNRDFLTKVLFRWQLLSMVRPAEAVSVEWSEIDFSKQLWTIPAIKMKKTRQGQFPHTVPISSLMLEILEELKPITGYNKFVFSHYSKPNQSASKELIANALRKIGYKGIQDSHGLRSIARTYLENQAVDFRLAESCLAHRIGDKTSQAYNRYDYIELRRPVMQLWSDFVERCEKENV
ncbi:integrase arm-type DNA-binding domain-containing protein [Rodentibacter trehalosifermentans]|uniref:integrase arm-type DNA-binding domain-containing protein n=1 Tax=Rodentibacter trehalosifermentans TaxID=1908263 RepID=UPI000985821A|nr:integrase arm-type DNA-binding domain-containing protein [Rodentibacter trehalosifermentans]OOF53529.1 preprotein translocase [Rodentibacter trehalosifermentans]